LIEISCANVEAGLTRGVVLKMLLMEEKDFVVWQKENNLDFLLNKTRAK